MSSSYIVEPQDSEKDNTLIILYKDDKTLQVDQETLQNVILNETNPDVSVVRLSYSNEETTLTVDPPQGQFTNQTNVSAGPTQNTETPGLIDQDWLIDPESMERVENALRSERAIEVLGENVAAMLDMLSVEDEQNAIRRFIALDHCYTNLTTPGESKPNNPLPDTNSSVLEDAQVSQSSTQQTTQISSGINSSTAALLTKPKIATRLSNSTHPRRSAAPVNFSNSLKTPPSSKNASNTSFSDKESPNAQNKDEFDKEMSTESSSESEPSDDDYDFGPRGPRRAGIRARGGRKGILTRGGSTSTRRRGGSKHLDSDQVRRLDLEMAAAVSAMKSPDKEEKPVEKSTPATRGRKIKTLSSKKKEEQLKPQEPPVVTEKPLQTTNEVKAHLISTNMIKGDMIITKPGEGRNNQKMMFVQKHVIMKANELKNINLKKPIIVSKGKVVNQGVVKNPVPKEHSKVPAITSKDTSTPVIVHGQPKIISVVQLPAQAHLNLGPKILSSVKSKVSDMKKDRRKSDASGQDTVQKLEQESPKPLEVKTADTPASKKHIKKEHRKPPVVEPLGPALFSTPDIIRRVGADMKMADVAPSSSTSGAATVTTTVNTVVISNSPTTAVPSVSPVTVTTTNSTITTSTPSITTPSIVAMTSSTSLSTPIEQTSPVDVALTNNQSANQTDKVVTQVAPPSVESQLQMHIEGTVNANTIEPKAALDNKPLSADELQPSIDPGGIEGEEHLLATLEMEATKHEDELLAEALLLQEELGVDLGDSTALEDQTASISESLISSSTVTFGSPLPPTSTFVTDSKPLVESPASSSTLVTKRTTDSQDNMSLEIKKKIIKGEGKEPIQIIRGGRIITLPPIEAPATRSKRAQATPKSESTHKGQSLKKSNDSASKQLYKSLGIDDDDEEDEDENEDEEANSDSEDDPNRLWCICKKPHNNRFMICCDICGDWFHGNCVNISKTMGQQMEAQGIEWACPNCSKKKSEQSKGKSNFKPKTSENEKSSLNESGNKSLLSTSNTSVASAEGLSISDGGSATNTSGTLCVVCKKDARTSSIYCSDVCILAHAQVSVKDKPTAVATSSKPQKPTSEPNKKVTVFDKKTGKVLSGINVQSSGNLKNWLKDHPSYEVLKPNNINTVQIGGKTIKTIQAPTTKPVKSTTTVQKTPEQAKMVYAKVAGSKQTVLAPSTKKIITIPPQPQPSNQSSQTKQKQTGLFAASPKTPQPMKQTTIKLTPKIQTSTPKMVTSTPKIVISTPKMVTSTPKIVTSTPKIVTSTPKMVTSTPKMITSTPKMVTSTPKTASTKKQEGKQLQPQLKTPLPKKLESEPIRLNVQKTLTEWLGTRAKEVSSLSLTEEEISGLAHNIELELYKCYKDTPKYRTKYRSLLFNIKDSKNLTLFRKIADKSLTPYDVVRLTHEEMASQELAAWREKETKHQLDMIKKNELDLLAQAKSIVVKTHKGEQIIEKDGTVDKNTSVQDIVSALKGGEGIGSSGEEKKEENSKVSEEKKKKDKDRSRERSRRSSKEKERKEKRDRSSSKSRHHKSKDRGHSKTRDRSRDRSRDRKRSKDRKRDKDRDRDKDHDKKDKSKDKKKHKRSKSSKSHREHRDKNKNEPEKDKKELEKKKESTPPIIEKQPIEERLWRHVDEENTTNTLDGNETDVSDREPSSTVTIKTPDINDEVHEIEKDSEPGPERILSNQRGPLQTVWRGFVHMVDVAKFFITAQEVSGYSRDLMEDLPDTVDVVGRISPETVWDYISKMKKNSSKEILVIRLTAANDEEKIPYITLYSYLNSRSRLGVMDSVSMNIKDFYIMPLSNQSKIPSVLLPLDGPGFEENEKNLLLGIIVRNRRKRPLSIEPVIPHKVSKKEDRSYTPPLLSGPKDEDEKKHKVTDVVRNIIDSATISKIVPELSSKIDFTSESPDKGQIDDEDEPYSPGTTDDESKDDILRPMDTSASLLNPGKSSIELQRTMEELNRQIEEHQQQIENISSSLKAENNLTLPGFGSDPPNLADEAYSPSDSRSFTPPPPGIATFAQPILEKVSNITIPPNLQEILANVKRQETSKVDPYLPPKPGATFLPSSSSGFPKTNSDKLTASFLKTQTPSKDGIKSNTSTLSRLSDSDLIKKAEEELAAVSGSTITLPDLTKPPPPLPLSTLGSDSFKTIDQPKPPGLDDEEMPTMTPLKAFKSGVVMSVKRKSDDADVSPHKMQRAKTSRWGQGPSDT